MHWFHILSFCAIVKPTLLSKKGIGSDGVGSFDLDRFGALYIGCYKPRIVDFAASTYWRAWQITEATAEPISVEMAHRGAFGLVGSRLFPPARSRLDLKEIVRSVFWHCFQLYSRFSKQIVYFEMGVWRTNKTKEMINDRVRRWKSWGKAKLFSLRVCVTVDLKSDRKLSTCAL